jgi:hypothetical protein
MSMVLRSCDAVYGYLHKARQRVAYDVLRPPPQPSTTRKTTVKSAAIGFRR